MFALSAYKDINKSREELYKKYSLALLPAEGSKEIPELNGNEIPIRFNGYFVIEKGSREKEIKSEGELEEYIENNSVKEVSIKPERQEAKLSFLFLAKEPAPIKVSIEVPDRSEVDVFEYFTGRSLFPLQKVKVGKGSKASIMALFNNSQESNLGAISFIEAGEESHVSFSSLHLGSFATKASTFASAKRRAQVEINNFALCINQSCDISTVAVNEGEESIIRAVSAAALSSATCYLKDYAKVNKGAIRSGTSVEERGLLLSNSTFVPLPDMSVDTNQVAFAMHSAATVPIVGKSLFYLMSRGLREEEAKVALTMGFFNKYLANVRNEIAREVSASMLLQKLRGNESLLPMFTLEHVW